MSNGRRGGGYFARKGVKEEGRKEGRPEIPAGLFSRVKGKRVSLPPAPPSTPYYGTKYGGSESVKRWKKEEKSTPDAICR